MASMSSSAAPASPIVLPSGGTSNGAPVVVTATAVGAAQLVYSPAAQVDAWDEVTLWAGTLDGTDRNIYVLWGADAAANALPRLLCLSGAGFVRFIERGLCRRTTDGTSFGIYVYTDVASSGLVVVKVDGVRRPA